jgi:Zn-dependent protease with chaperone function/TolA-binding protein
MRVFLRRAAFGLLAAVLCGGRPLSAQGGSGSPDLFKKSLEVAQQALVQYGELERPDELRRVADVGYRVVQESRFNQFPISFYLVDMPEPNAFALPGGQIFLTRGMLDLGLDDDMLACLLGHEVAHVVLQHGVRMERRATLLNVLSQAVLVGVLLTAERNRDPIYDRYGNTVDDGGSGDLVQGTAAAGLIVSELLLRGYSREFEDEADEEGQRWAAAAGFDPDGTRRLMAVMSSRLPQDKRYGYWQTHPFLDSRVEAAIARRGQLKVQEARSAEALRRQTQDSLLAYATTLGPEKEKPAPPPGAERIRVEGSPPPPERFTRAALLERAALVAHPAGPAAERLRAERLHRRRDRELAELPLRRDYGELLRAYAEEAAAVRAADPQSAFAATLETEAAELAAAAKGLYAQAQQVLRGGIYETSFLEIFLSNYPDAAEVPRVALELGEAYGRLGNYTDAVAHYLRSTGATPETPESARALAGLRALAPKLDELAALQQLVDQKQDPDLSRLAGERLAGLSASFRELENGADYLRRFPEASHAGQVSERLNSLAQGLYGEMVLYQAVGDHVKALDRIQKILTYAPLSPAADRLRERVVVQG